MMDRIQAKLKAPKNQLNSFGGYKYRSCEDIVEAAKPILAEHGCHLVLSDDVVMVGNRIYIKSTAAVKKGETIIESASALAREAETKKGMDESQITGTASSYARKYALNGLFAIDDTKDADTNEHAAKVGNNAPKAPAKTPYTMEDFETAQQDMITKIKSGPMTAHHIVAHIEKTRLLPQNIKAKILALQESK
jgi:hypothetical protein